MNRGVYLNCYFTPDIVILFVIVWVQLQGGGADKEEIDAITRNLIFWALEGGEIGLSG